MLTVITGEPHPDLEAALRSSLSGWRSRADFSHVVLVVPSNEMRRHLKLRIARDWGEAFVGLRLVTAQGLARMILDDTAAGEAADAALLEELVRGLLRSGDFPRLGGLADTAGGPGALVTSLRDLTESCLDADATGEAGRSEVLRLFAAFDRARCEAGLTVHADLVRDAASAAGSSALLRRLSDVFYYGFCDMTGAQAEFLASLARSARVTFFLPLGDGPACDFARAFLEHILRPLAGSVEPAPRGEGPRPVMGPALARSFRPGEDESPAEPNRDPQEGGRPSPSGAGAKPRLISVSGTEAELEAAARDVLRLVEEEGLAWGDVAVVARDLRPYAAHIESVFGERRIPFRSNVKLPASVFPAAKAVAALVRVFSDGMRRADVIDLVSSSFFARLEFGVAEERAARWDLLSRQLRIVGGETQWAKLKPIAEGGKASVRREDEEEIEIDVEAAKDLWNCVDPLITAHATFPEEGTWDELASAFEGAFERFFDFPSDEDDAPSRSLFEQLRRAVGDMHTFGAVSERTTALRFLEALARRLDEVAVPLGGDRAEVVEVLDAMAARCRSFKAVVVIGLHEGSFPRRGEQDPFLPDRVRAALSKKHGVRLARKAGRFDEERLLFHLLVASAAEHLTIVRQRSDDDGKPLVRSWYLDELQRAAGGAGAFEEIRVPRLFADRMRGELRPGGGWPYLTPREWREGLVIDGARDGRLWSLVSEDGGLLERALAASDELGLPAKTLGPRDGITGALLGFFGPMSERGFSPTSLQTYAECPFRFFASKVLGLEEAEEAEVAFEPQAVDMGTVLHRTLEAFFKRLGEAGYFGGGEREAIDTEVLLEESAGAAFAELEPGISTGAPLVWERARGQLLALARDYVAAELPRLKEDGWTPVRFEVNDSACMSDAEAFPENVRGLKLFGRIDRLDRREREGRIEARVVDYKFKSGAKRGAADNDLARGAVRGQRIQPPVYLLMAEHLVNEAKAARAELHFIAPNWADGPVVVKDFPPDCWSGELGLQVARTISRIVAGIERGEWFVMPGRHCGYCDFSRVCRKSHSATRYRLAADGRARSLEALAQTNPAGGKGKKRPAKKSAKESAKKKTKKKTKRKGGS